MHRRHQVLLYVWGIISLNAGAITAYFVRGKDGFVFSFGY